MGNVINYPFGLKDIQELSPSEENVVNVKVKNTGTFVKVSKLGADVTINIEAEKKLRVGSTVLIYTFNINGETHDTKWGTGLYGTDISGVSNKAHYSTFIYDGEKFAQTAVRETSRNELETVSASVDVTVDDNEITWVTTYTNADHASDAYVVDAILKTSKPIPVGAKFAITGLSGDYEVEGEPTSEVWVSDVLQSHAGEPPTRTKLNLHTEQTFVATVSGLSEDLDLTIYTEIVVSNTATEGGYQADEEMTDPEILATASTYVDLDTDD